MKKKQLAALAFALSLFWGQAWAEPEILSNFSIDNAASTSRKVKGVVADDLTIETANAYSAEIIWGDLEFAWGNYGGQTQEWDPENHVLTVDTGEVQTGWYLKNANNLSGEGPSVVGNPDHSHVLVFNHSCYGIQVAAAMRDSNLDDNITPSLTLSDQYGVGLNANSYEYTHTDGADDYKLFMDPGTREIPYDNGRESGNLNCAVFKMTLSTPDNAKPSNIDSDLGIADISINIQPLGY